LVARSQPWWIAGGLSTVAWGYLSARFRTIREPTFAGFLILTAGIVGLATIQPDDSLNALIFAGLAGIGFGSPLILVITGVQLSTPHHLIATATAVTTSSRAIAATVFTAIYGAALTGRLKHRIPTYIAKAALSAGLPATSLEAFIDALVHGNTAALSNIPGLNPTIAALGVAALKQASADAVRVVYIIAAPFGALACVACLFLGDLRKIMNYHIDAPLEELHAEPHRDAARAA
jgi:Fungal trichothecene efflux pump (TRI12)